MTDTPAPSMTNKPTPSMTNKPAQYNRTHETHVVEVVHEPDRPREPSGGFKVVPEFETLLLMRHNDPEHFMQLSVATQKKVAEYSRDKKLARARRETERQAPYVEMQVQRGTRPNYERARADLRRRLYLVEDRLTAAKRMGEVVLIPGLEEGVERARRDLEEYEAYVKAEQEAAVAEDQVEEEPDA